MQDVRLGRRYTKHLLNELLEEEDEEEENQQKMIIYM